MLDNEVKEDWVNDRIQDYLRRHGWRITRVAKGRQRGPDIEAERAGKKLIVEVKGYPSSEFVDPSKKGQKKRARPANQAHHWFCDAFTTVITRKSENPEAQLAIGLPQRTTYKRLLEKVDWARAKLGIRIFFVGNRGQVRAIGPKDKV